MDIEKTLYDTFMEQKMANDTINDQLDLVIEECTELIIEIEKSRRGKSSAVSVLEEACDTILTCHTLLLMKGYDDRQIGNMIRYKMERAILEYRKQNMLKGENSHDKQ